MEQVPGVKPMDANLRTKMPPFLLPRKFWRAFAVTRCSTRGWAFPDTCCLRESKPSWRPRSRPTSCWPSKGPSRTRCAEERRIFLRTERRIGNYKDDTMAEIQNGAFPTSVTTFWFLSFGCTIDHGARNNSKWHSNSLTIILSIDLLKSYHVMLVASSVTRLGDFLDFGQLFKAFGNN